MSSEAGSSVLWELMYLITSPALGVEEEGGRGGCGDVMTRDDASSSQVWLEVGEGEVLSKEPGAKDLTAG